MQEMKKFTTYKLNGKIKEVVYPKDIEELKSFLEGKYKVIGNGSNLIFDGDYDGRIIKLNNFENLEINDTEVKVGAGFSLIALSIKCALKGLKGLEFAGAIPATVGGAVYMNAGAYKSDMSNIIKEIKVLDNGKIKTLTNKYLKFSYRKSILMEKNYICIEATLKLEKADSKEILEIGERRKQKRLETQPLDYPSAGSVFRNSEGMFAGALIEKAGLKGLNINGAKVSEKHANFIINTGNATGKDIIKLINIIKKEIKEKYNVDLFLEQEIVR